ncbi:hypothetical protein BDR07DRAFT_1373057 [Suillus spraguei]|nr:hypothetical protein BDR07DRAFT_1373057 [Suillus spraguei]
MEEGILKVHLVTHLSDARVLFYKATNLIFKSLKKSFKEQLSKFNKTGTGVTLLDENAAANLYKQVLAEFPWYNQLHPFFFSNPTFSAKIFKSQPGVNHATDFYTLVHPHGRANTSAHQDTGDHQLQPEGESLLSRPATSSAEQDILMRGSRQQQQPQPSTPDPFPPRHPLPSHHPDPLYYAGADIDDPDSDLYNDSDVNTDDNDQGPLFTSLDNVLDTLGGDGRMEFNSSCYCVISLDSPSKVVGHKRHVWRLWHCLVWWLSTMQTFLVHLIFGNIMQPLYSLVDTILITLPTIRLSHCTDGIADFTFHQATGLHELKEEENVSGGRAGMHHHGEQQHSEHAKHMSEHQQLKNEHYAIKMDYQMKKKEFQWRHESHSHEVLLSSTVHHHEQEVKDKEILHLQAAAALQDKEAETWHLKIQYETMMHGFWFFQATLPYVQLLSKDCQTVDPSSSNEKLALELFNLLSCKFPCLPFSPPLKTGEFWILLVMMMQQIIQWTAI